MGPSSVQFAVAWILFLIPLAAVVFAWIGLCWHWNTECHRAVKVAAVLLPTLAALLACGGLAYVELVGSIESRNYSVEEWGSLLSLLGTILGLIVALRFRKWFFWLASAASAWMLVPFLLAASTY
jgi:hypothetical protein